MRRCCRRPSWAKAFSVVDCVNTLESVNSGRCEKPPPVVKACRSRIHVPIAMAGRGVVLGDPDL